MRKTLKALAAAAGAALIGLALPAAAQDAPAQAPTQEQLDAARAAADALIASTGEPRFFENVSSDGMARVRHKPSGLVCNYVPGATNNSLMLFPSSLPRGDDVGCNMDMGVANITHYATRYGPGYSAADSARDAEAAIRNRYADARPYQGPVARAEPPEGVTDTGFAALMIGPERSPGYTHALTAKVGPWIFKQRMTGSGAEDSIMANQIVAAAFFNEALQGAVESGRR